jgi:hypothetical protein
MSNAGVPQTPSMPFTTGNAALDGIILKLIVGLAALIVPWLMAHLKLTDPNYALWLTGAVTGLLLAGAAFVWGWFSTNVLKAQAIQSGINLTVSGKAVTTTGEVIAVATPESTPPLPVTAASADKIMKDFPPTKAA